MPRPRLCSADSTFSTLTAPVIAANAMAVPACLALAFLTYYGFERPIGRMLNRLAQPHPRSALELAATSTH